MFIFEEKNPPMMTSKSISPSPKISNATYGQPLNCTHTMTNLGNYSVSFVKCPNFVATEIYNYTQQTFTGLALQILVPKRLAWLTILCTQCKFIHLVSNEFNSST